MTPENTQQTWGPPHYVQSVAMDPLVKAIKDLWEDPDVQAEYRRWKRRKRYAAKKAAQQ